MKLYSYWRSSCSWRVRIALHWKGLTFTQVAVNLIADGGQHKHEAYRAVNAMAEVPTLELDDGRRLSQSLAILDYLEATAPAPPLLPADLYLRARARQLAEIVNAGIQPMQTLWVMQELKRLGVDEQAWCRHAIARGLGALDLSAAPTLGRFLVGDEPSLADLCLVPQLYNARRFQVELTPWPRLLAVEEACLALPAFAAAHPDRQPDAPQQ